MTDTPPNRADEPSSVIVERLDGSRHDTRRFNCGKPSLDTYIHTTVDRDLAERTAVAYVLVDQADLTPARRVIGYFTLSGSGFTKRQARRRDRDRYLGAYDPVPAVLIGRLALDTDYQGLGLGRELLVAALEAALNATVHIGAAVAPVHAIDEEAATFYEHHGFTRFRDEPDKLYMPLATFARGLAIERKALGHGQSAPTRCHGIDTGFG